jgi:hypothetical protein
MLGSIIIFPLKKWENLMGLNIPLNKLEPDLDKEFEGFYQTNLASTANGKTTVNLKLAFSTEFKERSHDFFSKYQAQYSVIDRYFNNFHPIWRLYLDMGQFKAAERLWDDVLDIVSEWETDQQKIHKGTPFYWLAGTAILNGELERGFALMHQALEEDIRTQNIRTPRTPAFFFVTLNYEEAHQYFRQIVLEASNFLEDKINNYTSYMRNSRSNLDLPNFKSRFLEQTNILEIVFYFVYTLFKARHMLLDVRREWRQNAFSSLLETSMIFDLCLIIEEAIKEKDNTRYPANRPIYFSNRVSFLSQTAGLTIHRNLSRISADCASDFVGTLSMLLDSTYNLANGIEEDLSIALAFRNFAAHSIESLKLVYEKFEEIFQRVLNALFFSVETLY